MKGNKIRTVGTSAANTSQTVTEATKAARRILGVFVAYSNTPTHSGVTVTLDSGAGSAYDTVLYTGSTNARYTAYIPDGEVFVLEDDAIAVTAPAGGSGITSSISIYTEIVEF